MVTFELLFSFSLVLATFTGGAYTLGYTIGKLSTDTPTAKARWVLIYIHFQIYSKVYKTNEFL